MTALARIALVSLVSFGAFAIVMPVASASSSCAKKKKKKAHAASEAAPPKKITADTLLKWKRAGMTDDEVAARATSAGYTMNERAKAKLKKAHATKLIGMLVPAGGAAEEEDDAPMVAEIKVAKPTNAARPIDINKITAPEDIDFDSVPPPQGLPEKYVTKQPEKKKLDTSTRPAAPFVEEEAKPVATTAQKPAPSSTAAVLKKAASQPVADNSGKKRVVYTTAATE